MESSRLSVAGYRPKPCEGRIFLVSCYWPKAENARGLGAEHPEAGERDRPICSAIARGQSFTQPGPWSEPKSTHTKARREDGIPASHPS